MDNTILLSKRMIVMCGMRAQIPNTWVVSAVARHEGIDDTFKHGFGL